MKKNPLLKDAAITGAFNEATLILCENTICL